MTHIFWVIKHYRLFHPTFVPSCTFSFHRPVSLLPLRFFRHSPGTTALLFSGAPLRSRVRRVCLTASTLRPLLLTYSLTCFHPVFGNSNVSPFVLFRALLHSAYSPFSFSFLPFYATLPRPCLATLTSILVPVSCYTTYHSDSSCLLLPTLVATLPHLLHPLSLCSADLRHHLSSFLVSTYSTSFWVLFPMRGTSRATILSCSALYFRALYVGITFRLLRRFVALSPAFPSHSAHLPSLAFRLRRRTLCHSLHSCLVSPAVSAAFAARSL